VKNEDLYLSFVVETTKKRKEKETQAKYKVSGTDLYSHMPNLRPHAVQYIANVFNFTNGASLA